MALQRFGGAAPLEHDVSLLNRADIHAPSPSCCLGFPSALWESPTVGLDVHSLIIFSPLMPVFFSRGRRAVPFSPSLSSKAIPFPIPAGSAFLHVFWGSSREDAFCKRVVCPVLPLGPEAVGGSLVWDGRGMELKEPLC